MLKFQVVNKKFMEGKAKASGNPYKMLIVSGIATNADGTMEVGEVVFMEGQNRPLPMWIEPGKAYLPTVNARSRDGKLSFEITDLKEISAASVKSVAAA